MRTVYLGGPKTGKTTSAERLSAERGVPAKHTDSLTADHDWSATSEAAARWLNEPGPWVIEGVAAVRALRKWLEKYPVGKPCDRVYWLSRPYLKRSKGQETMAKGCATVWAGIRTELLRRGVEVVER